MKPDYSIGITLCILLAVLLSGCDSGSDAKKEQAKGVIPEHQLQTLQKAKDAKKALQDAKAKQEQALQNQ